VRSDGIRRRQAIAGAVGLGATPLLAACGDDGGSTATDPPSESGGRPIPTSDVPVGGGVILDDPKVVITQPTEGDFKAFTSICTHQGCPVDKVESGLIGCPCHGSQFSIKDGSVESGPATAPLEGVAVNVQGGEITVG
jgi:Rieske Fe-S protein